MTRYAVPVTTIKTYERTVIVEAPDAAAAHREVERQIDEDGLILARMSDFADNIEEVIGEAEEVDPNTPLGVVGDEEKEPDVDDDPPPGYGPPASGAVIVEWP
jgi:hypothetical protein